MKIERLRIQNFRSIKEADLRLSDLCYLVGENGVGKSTVLAALNVFFRNVGPTHKHPDHLLRSDFTDEVVDEPILIELTFGELSAEAESDLSAYTRQGKLIVSARAVFNEGSDRAPIKQFGSRTGMKVFAPVFEAQNATEAKKIYTQLKAEFPALPAWKNKDDAKQALIKYEGGYPELCELLESEDQFYGFTKGGGKLDKHIQWIYIPAVKDAAQEQIEERQSAIAQLVNVLIADRSGLDESIENLRKETRLRFEEMLHGAREVLAGVQERISGKLGEWARPDISAYVDWNIDDKSIAINNPVAKVDLQDGPYRGEVARFGHGLQRSYLFAVLQALAEARSEGSISLIIGCEEPELYQHPPQIRHLAYVFEKLGESNNQILATTHNPLMIGGNRLENLIRIAPNEKSHALFFATNFTEVTEAYEAVTGNTQSKPIGIMPRLNRELEPWITELLFSSFVVFVESREDQAFLSAAFAARDEVWDLYRRLRINIIPVFGKSNLLVPCLVSDLLDIPHYAMFDLDSECKDEYKAHHTKDNNNLFKLFGYEAKEAFSTTHVITDRFTAWSNCITTDLREEADKKRWAEEQDRAHKALGHASNLKKDPLALGYITQALLASGVELPTLIAVRDKILEVAGRGAR